MCESSLKRLESVSQLQDMARYGEACKYALANPSVLHTNYYQDFFLVELLQFYVKINPEKSS